MRLKPLLFTDMRFQYRYGFYGLYLLLTLVYVGLLSALPDAWRGDAALVLIFTDPAAMGLFFMGAIVLFEKNERVLDSLAVSPVTALSYVLSKIVSLGIIAALAATAVGAAAGMMHRPLLFVGSVFLCSCLFSALGLTAACQTKTLNQFFLLVVPMELLTTVPALYWLFWAKSDLWVLHPGVSMLMLCSGRGSAGFAMLSLLGWTALAVWIARRRVRRMFQTVGGITL